MAFNANLKRLILAIYIIAFLSGKGLEKKKEVLYILGLFFLEGGYV
jgi:hypothetical protein